ncbi:ATP-binding protein [Algoriphagus halophytocola]|uniref:ATP-binding protein n=1 Tax=Algoriphagus halophytocola TaxID=2991499 RepID=UPI0029F472B3|nr:ATP-binding protein [Algoriphagus sp. TR-M5]
MKNPLPQLINFMPILLLVWVSSCQQSANVPFPENPSAYQQPVVHPFELPEPDSLGWKEITADLLPSHVAVPLDFDKIPSQPFSIHDFKPLNSPLSKIPFDWNELQDISYHLDSAASEQISVRLQLLEEPVISKLGALGKSELSTAGILRIAQTEGLLGNRIYSMVQDQNDMIWIATDRGLARFTGDQFENYNVLPRNPDGLIDFIGDMEITPEGHILLLSNLSGLYELDAKKGVIQNYQIGGQFARTYADGKGLIWLGKLGDAPHVLDRKTKTLRRLDLPEEIIAGGSAGVFVDSKDNVWFGMNGKVGIYNPGRTHIKIIRDGLEQGPNEFFYDFTENSNGEIWFSSVTKGAKGVSLREKHVLNLGEEQGFDGVARGITFDLHDRMWIADNDVVRIYDPQKNSIKKILTNANFNTLGFPAQTITDRKGNIWVGTELVGALLIDPDGMMSEHFSVTDGLASNEVWGVEEDPDGKIWMATYEGINIYDPVEERIYRWTFPDAVSTNNHRSISKISDYELLIGSLDGFVIVDFDRMVGDVYSLKPAVARIAWKSIRDGRGNIWIGTNDGVLQFNPEQNKLFKADQFSGLSSSRVWLLERDAQDRIWLGNEIGVDVLDASREKVYYLSRSNGLTSDYTAILLQTSKGEMVVGSDAGMSLIDLAQETITNLTPEQGLEPPVMYDMVEVGEDLHIGSENGIIVARRPNPDHPNDQWRFFNYGKREGFPFNDYNQATAVYTSTGNIWWGAAPVLTVNIQVPKTDTVPPKVVLTQVNIMDQNPDFLGNDYLKSNLTAEDTIWNTDHTDYYFKSDIPNDSSYLMQNKIVWDTVNLVTKLPIGLVLPHHQNSMNFSFINPNVQGRDKIVYRYILEGADDAWSEISPRSTTQNYYNLVPGAYTFKVATRGFNGSWSEPASIHFTISPPWWQTWAAYLTFSLIFGGFVYGVVQLRSQYLQKENRILEERVSHRTAQLKKSIDNLKNAQSQLVQSEKMASLGELTAGIAHEIQNPLNFVNNFSEVSSELLEEMKEELEKGDFEEAKTISIDIQSNLEKINQHGKRADAIVKAMLQHSRSSAGTRSMTNINLLADEYLKLAYHGLRAKEKSFNAQLKTDFDPEVGEINVVAQEIGRVLLNLINNAFYACAERKQLAQEQDYEPSVEVHTQRKGKWVEVKIKDNGSGMPAAVKEKIFQPFFTTKPSGKGTGLGLSISYDIVKAHGGEMSVESKEGIGTEFYFRLPLETQKNG